MHDDALVQMHGGTQQEDTQSDEAHE